jgi:hypothetical protein
VLVLEVLQVMLVVAVLEVTDYQHKQLFQDKTLQ